MVNMTAYHTDHLNTSAKIVKCQMSLEDSEASIRAGYTGDLLWTPTQRTILFSATFYGAFATVFYSGYLADRFGPKRLVIGAVSIFVFVTMLTPFVASHSYELFFAMRILMGFGEGFMFPCAGSLVGRWISPDEKSTAAALYTSGRQIAASLTNLIASELCSSSLKWPAIFYLSGSIGIIFLCLWTFFVSDHPSTNRWISQREREFLVANCTPKKKVAMKVPWRSLFTSKALIAAILSNYTFTLQAAMMQNFLPSFVKEQLGISLHSNGFFTMTPFITQLLFKNIFGVCFSGGIPGFYTSLLCIAPAYSGTVTSLAQSFGNAGHMSVPLILTAIIKLNFFVDYRWRILGVFCFLMNCISATIFLAYGSAEIQPWAKTIKTSKVEKNTGEVTELLKENSSTYGNGNSDKQ
ncbi:hypothetical protein WR25_02735 [Diploscapter pachys]|uniref:Major facilitator superfamily (MFS) profile domain-containing protein n=1 Tax=Diploscapter pachys TaxID=2018661 RepID=A0A2A2JQJ9_9BILA|nr:hypothetical protein WR25_02735 [Diploscapter pachys]